MFNLYIYPLFHRPFWIKPARNLKHSHPKGKWQVKCVTFEVSREAARKLRHI